MKLQKLQDWKQERVRCLGRGDSYIRLTPFFGIRVKLFGKIYSYSTKHGWKRERQGR